MISFQNFKYIGAIKPIDANGTTATATAIDCRGWDYCAIVVVTGNVAANMTALKVQESDDDGSTDAYADVSGASWTSPTAAGGDNLVFVGFIDCRKRNRYLKVVATAGSGATLISAHAMLSRGVNTPTNATERGVSEAFFV